MNYLKNQDSNKSRMVALSVYLDMKIIWFIVFIHILPAISAVDISFLADNNDSRFRLLAQDLSIYTDLVEQTAGVGLSCLEYGFSVGYLGSGNLKSFVTGDWKKPLTNVRPTASVFYIPSVEKSARYPAVEMRSRFGILGYSSEGWYALSRVGNGALSVYVKQEQTGDCDDWYISTKNLPGGWKTVLSSGWYEKWWAVQASVFLGEYSNPGYKAAGKVNPRFRLGDNSMLITSGWCRYESLEAGVLDGGGLFKFRLGSKTQFTFGGNIEFVDAFLSADAFIGFRNRNTFIGLDIGNIEILGLYEGVSGELPDLKLSVGYDCKALATQCSLSYKDQSLKLSCMLENNNLCGSAALICPLEDGGLNDAQLGQLVIKWKQDWGYITGTYDSKGLFSVLAKIGIADNEPDIDSIHPE